jgi:hypothetical protein
MWDRLGCADVVFIACIFGRRGRYREQFAAIDLDHHVGHNVWVASTFTTRWDVWEEVLIATS